MELSATTNVHVSQGTIAHSGGLWKRKRPDTTPANLLTVEQRNQFTHFWISEKSPQLGTEEKNGDRCFGKIRIFNTFDTGKKDWTVFNLLCQTVMRAEIIISKNHGTIENIGCY